MHTNGQSPIDQSDHIPHRLVFRGAAPVGGFLTLHVPCVFGVAVLEMENINNGQEEQEAGDRKCCKENDALLLHMYVLQRRQCGVGRQVLGRRSTETR